MFKYRPKVRVTRAYESDLFLLTDLSCRETQSRRISSQFQSPVSWYVFLNLSSTCRCLLVIIPASSVSECTEVITHSWVCLRRRWGLTLQCCRPASACLWLLQRGKAMPLAAYFGLCIFCIMWTKWFVWCSVLLMALEHLLMWIEQYLMNYSVSKLLKGCACLLM